MNRVFLLVVGLLLSNVISAQSVNWYQSDKSKDQPYNINTDAVYEELIKGRIGQPVVVAVIDSGVDIEHEDLKDVIWVNNDEVPDNGIDDDQNGYVDDINGWNFIGGADGTPVVADTYEEVRIYALNRARFADVDPAQLSKGEIEEYDKYVKFEKRMNREVKSAKEQYDGYKQRSDFFTSVVDHLSEIEKTKTIDKKLMDSLSTSFNQLDAVASNIYNFYIDETGEFPDIPTLREDLIAPLEEGMHYFGSKFKYGWNPDYDPRR